MALKLFRHSAEVDVYLASMQTRFDVLREVSTLQAERMHHTRRVREIDERLTQLQRPLQNALRAIAQNTPAENFTRSPSGRDVLTAQCPGCGTCHSGPPCPGGAA